MNKIWNFIKLHFLTRKFITFGVIGVINTMIHMVVYGVFYNRFEAGAFLSSELFSVSFWSQHLFFHILLMPI